MNTTELVNLFKEHWANSANFDQYPDLICKSAGLLAPQLYQLVERGGKHRMTVRQNTFFESYTHEHLATVLGRHGSDKGIRHGYHLFYCFMLEQLGLDNPLHFLEIGLGTNNPALVSTMGKHGRPGASLRAWSEFLPNAIIYGADIDRDILFQEERIKTAYVDQLEAATFNDLGFGVDHYDVVIDDGLHSIGANLNTLLFGLDHIRPGGWVVIEDIKKSLVSFWNVVDQLLAPNKEYETCFVECARQCLYVVHRKKPKF